jgi:16S rRNA (guanine527-N7)-methyltransferase
MASSSGRPRGSQTMSEIPASSSGQLKELLAAAGQPPLSDPQLQLFYSYLSLIFRWNSRTNLTAIRTEEGILSRHFVESIACARALPPDIRTLLDFGSGAGFPGIPIAICRPEIAVTLAESQSKKAAFLQEALRTLGLAASIHAGRAEQLPSRFDCVILRAVDRMEEAVTAAARLVNPNGLLVLLTTETELPALQHASGPEFSWLHPIPLPASTDRILALGRQI